jgi:DNA-binding NtrC family response regulator
MDPAAKILVLLVDDEAIIRLVSAERLEDAGFEVLEAATADDALKILNQRSNVEVVFTDVNMPGAMDGLALAELVHERWPDIKLVVTSGRALPRAIPRTGCFLTKPYTGAQMTAVIRHACEL